MNMTLRALRSPMRQNGVTVYDSDKEVLLVDSDQEGVEENILERHIPQHV